MEKKAKVFKSGNSQALRLPKEFNTDEKQFYIRMIGTSLLLSPKASSWEMVS
jgi:antitoxin VapB